MVVVKFEITKIVASEIIGLIRGLLSLVLILFYVYGMLVKHKNIMNGVLSPKLVAI